MHEMSWLAYLDRKYSNMAWLKLEIPFQQSLVRVLLRKISPWVATLPKRSATAIVTLSSNFVVQHVALQSPCSIYKARGDCGYQW